MIDKLTNENLVVELPKIDLTALSKEELNIVADIIKKGIKYWEGKNINYKVRINALYGILSEIHCRYYELDNAEAITSTGQLCVRGCGEYINKKSEGKHSVIYNDTDSDFIILSEKESSKVPFDPKDQAIYLVEYFKNNITPRIKEFFDHLADVFNFMGNYIKMDLETVGDKSIMVEPKRYVIRKIWNKGVFILPSERKYKIVGIDIVRRDFPQWTRDSLKEALDILFEKNNDKILEFMSEKKKEFYKLGINEISKPTSVQNISEYYIGKKGTPRHTYSALYYNKFIDDNNLQDKYEKIFDASKIKFCYIKGELAHRQNYTSIAFMNECPEEILKVCKIDYDKMWEVVFLDPLTRLVEANGWRVEKINTFLEELF